MSKTLTPIQYIILECLTTKKEAKMKAIIKFCNVSRSITNSDRIKNLVINLIKRKLVTVTENANKDATFTLTKEGIKEWNNKPDNWDKSLLPENKVEQETKEKKNLPKKIEKEENWMEFTQPVFVVVNNQWEFYQKQGEEILNIFSSLDEEEIKRMHQSKIMEHITASMHDPDRKKEEKKGSQVKFVDFKEEHKINRTKELERYKDVNDNPHLRIMEMKLAGYTNEEIIEETTKTFNLKRMTVGLYIDEALKDIKKLAKNILEDSIISHSERYENIFKWFRENGYDKMAVKVMERRERLVGLHDGESVNSIINHFVGQSSFNIKSKYDFNKLTTNELESLESMVQRCVVILKPAS